MRRSSARLWSELRKEVSRSSNLVWLTVLLLWLALSSSRYSHWHALSHHLLHNKWLSATHTNHQPHHPHSQRSPDSSTAWVSLHQRNDSPTVLGSTKNSAFLYDQEDGLDVSIESDEDKDDDSHYGHGSLQEDRPITGAGGTHLAHGSHQEGVVTQKIALNDNARYAHGLHQDDKSIHQEDESITTTGDTHSAPDLLKGDVFNQAIAHDDDAHSFNSLDLSKSTQNNTDHARKNADHDKSGQIKTVEEPKNVAGMSYQAPDAIQHDQARIGGPPKTCASVEEMGFAAAKTVIDPSLRVRKMISNYISEHGASYVRGLPAKEFCRRGFVFGRAAEDGLGNDIYKILTASGLSIMLNRSLIIAEHGSTNPAYIGLTGRVRPPFGEYLQYSNETFFLSEVKRLWVKHDCVGVFRRPLTMVIDDFQRPTRTKVFCKDWSKWRHPIIWFKGTTDSNALQFFLKNQHRVMRESASLLFGDPANPSSRPNTFGELFRAFISPMPVIEEAVHWALKGLPNPDISVHMRMLNSRSRAAPYAVCRCIQALVRNVLQSKKLPKIVVVSDTPSIIRHVKGQLEGFAEVVHFDYKLFMDTHHNLSEVMSGNYFQPPEKRVRDWGGMPRWVAIVDLFLAARAKSAVISGANRRVGTTYAQLLASLAAAIRTDKQAEGSSEFRFFSSFQSSLLAEGLLGQRGWGHTWRRFAGPRSCKNQTNQCALTPLLPYTWWDGPWQSPVPRDAQRMLAYGVTLSDSGQVDEASLAKTCLSRKAPLETLELKLPSCKRLKVCPK